MPKTLLITGATDGIGLATAKALAPLGHHLLLHGRSPNKLAQSVKIVSAISGVGNVEQYLADLSYMPDVEALAAAVCENHRKIDVLINNAGIFKTSQPVTARGDDVRFVVNTFAPYLLTQRLLPLFDNTGRVINLSSAAQAPVDLDALMGRVTIPDEFSAYAQSKLAITMWSRVLADSLGSGGPTIVAVNPGSLLASKMVKEGFGVAGNDLSKGADILCRAALSDEFANASGQYFDNDVGGFTPPHADALDTQKSNDVIRAIEEVLAKDQQ